MSDFEERGRDGRSGIRSNWQCSALSIAIYANFFSHHDVPDLRIVLFAATALLFARTTIYFKVWDEYRSMPLLLGLGLVTLFIWFAENIGTFTRTWLYPSQSHGLGDGRARKIRLVVPAAHHQLHAGEPGQQAARSG